MLAGWPRVMSVCLPDSLVLCGGMQGPAVVVQQQHGPEMQEG